MNQDAEKSFKQTIELDRLIDMLRDSNAREVSYQFFKNNSWHIYNNHKSIFRDSVVCSTFFLQLHALAVVIQMIK